MFASQLWWRTAPVDAAAALRPPSIGMAVPWRGWRARRPSSGAARIFLLRWLHGTGEGSGVGSMARRAGSCRVATARRVWGGGATAYREGAALWGRRRLHGAGEGSGVGSMARREGSRRACCDGAVRGGGATAHREGAALRGRRCRCGWAGLGRRNKLLGWNGRRPKTLDGPRVHPLLHRDARTSAAWRTNKCPFIGVLAGCLCLATENSNSHLMTSRQAIDFIVLKAQVFSLRNQKIKHMLQVYVWKHPNGEYESLAFLLLSGIAPKLQPSSPNSNKKACLCFKYSFRKHPTQLNQEKIWFKPS